tara:strand:- start:252 stop:686 length:435 start_codon:yes stop_codon:yes gene_type:complete
MTIKNIKSFQKQLDKYLNQNPSKNAKKAVGRGVMLVKGTAQESITAGGKSGIEYQKYNPRRIHRASKEGEAPASDTGFLVANISMNVKTETDGSVVGQIISSAPYSKFLEFGTVEIQPRPFMQPALEKNKKKIINIFKQEGVIK